MTEPTVSVLIPCFNAARYVGETLENVLNQTWPNLEIIVVDDGSTDNSVEIIETFRDKRLRLIRQPSTGVCHARNVALGFASGDYIQFLDADDIIATDKIRLQVERLKDHPDAIASGPWGRFEHDIATARMQPEANWRDCDPLDWIADAWRNGIPMHCLHMWLVPRSVCTAAGPWDERLVQNTDGEYFTRVLLCAQNVLFCPGATAYYRSGLSGSVSRRISMKHLESRFLAIHLCERFVLERENSERMRRGFALAWQNLGHFSFPYDRNLAEHALSRAQALHQVRVKPGGGVMFKVARDILGWRAARKLQIMSGRP